MGAEPKSRVARGKLLPAPGTWTIDAADSMVVATIRHALLSRVRARFRIRSGRLGISDDPLDCSVVAGVEMGSIDSGDDQRDEQLRSESYLDVARYPMARFVSHGVDDRSDRCWDVRGVLTLRDRTLPLTIFTQLGEVEVGESGSASAVAPRMSLVASTDVDREAFGLTFNQVLETGRLLLGRTVRVDLQIVASYGGEGVAGA